MLLPSGTKAVKVPVPSPLLPESLKRTSLPPATTPISSPSSQLKEAAPLPESLMRARVSASERRTLIETRSLPGASEPESSGTIAGVQPEMAAAKRYSSIFFIITGLNPSAPGIGIAHKGVRHRGVHIN